MILLCSSRARSLSSPRDTFCSLRIAGITKGTAFDEILDSYFSGSIAINTFSTQVSVATQTSTFESPPSSAQPAIFSYGKGRQAEFFLRSWVRILPAARNIFCGGFHNIIEIKQFACPFFCRMGGRKSGRRSGERAQHERAAGQKPPHGFPERVSWFALKGLLIICDFGVCGNLLLILCIRCDFRIDVFTFEQSWNINPIFEIDFVVVFTLQMKFNNLCPRIFLEGWTGKQSGGRMGKRAGGRCCGRPRGSFLLDFV